MRHQRRPPQAGIAYSKSPAECFPIMGSCGLEFMIDALSSSPGEGGGGQGGKGRRRTLNTNLVIHENDFHLRGEGVVSQREDGCCVRIKC